MRKLKHLMCLSFFSFFFISSFGFCAEQAARGKILEINGKKEQVKIVRANKDLPADVNALLITDDITKTGDSSMLKLSLKTQEDDDIDIFVFENSEFTIEQKTLTKKKKTTLVNLSKGFLSIAAKKLSKEEDVRVKTPNGVVGIRGSMVALLVTEKAPKKKKKIQKNSQLFKKVASLNNILVAENEEDDEGDEEEEAEGPAEEEDDEGGKKEEETDQDSSKAGTDLSILQLSGDVVLGTSKNLLEESLDQPGTKQLPEGEMQTITSADEESLRSTSLGASATNVSVALDMPRSFNESQALTAATAGNQKVPTNDSVATEIAQNGATDSAGAANASLTGEYTPFGNNQNGNTVRYVCP